MRFILNFFFFGLLFYIIWLFFPDAFTTLVHWAAQVVDFFRDLFNNVSHKLPHKDNPQTPAAPTPDSIKTFIYFLLNR